MQYHFNINQLAAYNLGLIETLNTDDLALFDYIYQLFNSPNAQTARINGRDWVNVKFNLINKECPLLHINTRKTFRVRMLKLVKAGLIIRCEDNQELNQSYYGRGRLFSSFASSTNYSDINDNGVTKTLQGCNQNVTGGVTKTLHDHNTNISLNNLSINKENFILSNKAKESELSFDTPPDKTKISLEEKREACKRREDEFYNEVAKFVNDYPKEMLRSFFSYWSEPNKSGTKMRFESEKTFEIKRRLATWYKNESKFNKNGTGKLYSKARAEFEDFQVFNDSINRTLDKLYDE